MVDKRTKSRKLLSQFSHLICLDLEYTCWEGSMQDDWPDPKFPAEILQVGMVGFDLIQGRCLAKFSAYVRPALNPRMSNYCANLLQISQNVIDSSPTLPEVINQISSFVSDYRVDLTVVSAFGLDCKRFVDDAARHSRESPFTPFTCLNLQQEAAKIMGMTNELPEREHIKQHFRLPPPANRHDALDDALDVKILFDALIKTINLAQPA